jgi:hypothetical protein
MRIKEAKKQAVASVEVDPRDELLDIADATIRALSRAVSESQDALLTQYYAKRNQVQKAKEGR